MKRNMKIIFVIVCVSFYHEGVLCKRWEQGAVFLGERVSENSTFGLVREVGSGSTLQCAVQCVEAVPCISFIFGRSSKNCYLLSGNVTAHDQWTLNNSSLPASPNMYTSIQKHSSVCNSTGTYEDTLETVGACTTIVACKDNWLIVQRRELHNVNFTQNFKAYTDGFGDIGGDFWLGLKHLHALTAAQPYRLRVEMETWVNGTFLYQEYETFNVSSELDQFRLFVSGSSGTAGDGLKESNNMEFSTYDNYQLNNCAAKFSSGWWFSNCFGGAMGTGANPNGLYQKCTGRFFKECIVWLAAEEVGKHPDGLRSFQMMIQ